MSPTAVIVTHLSGRALQPAATQLGQACDNVHPNAPRLLGGRLRSLPVLLTLLPHWHRRAAPGLPSPAAASSSSPSHPSRSLLSYQPLRTNSRPPPTALRSLVPLPLSLLPLPWKFRKGGGRKNNFGQMKHLIFQFYHYTAAQAPSTRSKLKKPTTIGAAVTPCSPTTRHVAGTGERQVQPLPG